jgi:hypothetical protein
MKAKAVIAAALIALAAPNGAYADRLADPNGLAQAFEACAANKRLFDIEVGKLNQTISANSNEYNLTGGTISYASTMVWRRDLRMLMHFFEADWNSVVHDTGATVGRCNAVINFYSRCVEELWDNVLKEVSVRRPTTGCLGRLYDRYGDMPDDSYQHGR